MSEHVYEDPICPDLAMEVRHACRGEMEEREERIVDIYYVSADDPDTAGPHAIQRNTAQEHHGDSDETKKKHSRMTGLFLVLLCVLLFSLAVIIGVVIYYSELIKEKNNNLVKERDKIQSSVDELDSRLNNLTEEIEQSGFDQLNSIFVKFESLETRYNKRICELSGWKTFGNGCYYVSTEKKKWSKSRRYCEDRQSDLVVINSQEEQNFVGSLKRARVWLGLTDKEKEGTFKWVDETPLNESQYPDLSNNGQGRDCVGFSFPQNTRQWDVGSYNCDNNYWWICERVI